MHTKPFPQRNLGTEQILHNFFRHENTFDAEKLVHTDCTQICLQTDFFARRNFTYNNFYTVFFFRTEAFTRKKTMHNSFHRRTVFTQKIFRTEVLRTEGFTHNIFLHTDAFTHTQPIFTQRGFVSPS